MAEVRVTEESGFYGELVEEVAREDVGKVDHLHGSAGYSTPFQSVAPGITLRFLYQGPTPPPRS